MCVSAPNFLLGGGRRQHDLQEAREKGEGGRNRGWLYWGEPSEIRVVQGTEQMCPVPSPTMSSCPSAALENRRLEHPEQMNSSCIAVSWTMLKNWGQIHNMDLGRVRLCTEPEGLGGFFPWVAQGLRAFTVGCSHQ